MLSMFKKPDDSELIDRIKNTATDTGVDTDFIDVVVKSGSISNYENLYHVYNNLLPAVRQGITEAWQLLCLSGEPEAFNYAVENLNMTKDTVGKWGDNPLHFSALSGNPAQINKALNLGIMWNSEVHNHANILHFAFLSKSPDQVNKVLELEKEHHEKLPTTFKKDRNVLHLAAISGKIDVLDLALELVKDEDRKLNLDAKDIYDFNALNYAVKKGNQRVIKKLKELGLTCENQESFGFGDLNMRNHSIKFSKTS